MRRNVTRGVAFALSVAVMLVSAATALYAGPTPQAAAPEIDGASILTGLGLLGAGVMVLRARRRSK